MAIKNIIAKGIGFSPGSVKYIPTHGFGIGAGTPYYSINAGTQLPGIVSTWLRQQLRVNDDGTIDYSPYAINRWQAPVMNMADFEELWAQQGAQLTSLETNDINARNSFKQYTDAFVGLVNGRQRGRQATDVIIEFRVKV